MIDAPHYAQTMISSLQRNITAATATAKGGVANDLTNQMTSGYYHYQSLGLNCVILYQIW